MSLQRSALFVFGAFALVTACGGATSELLDGTGVSQTVDGGTSGDSGSHDAGGGADAQDGATGGMPPIDPGVHCPNAGSCPVPGQVCCKTDTGDTCVAAGSCSGLAIPCDDSTDCATAGMPGTFCCLTDGPNGIASSVQCLPASQCFGVMGNTDVCNKNGPNDCPSGKSCLPSQQSLPGFDICR